MAETKKTTAKKVTSKKAVPKKSVAVNSTKKNISVKKTTGAKKPTSKKVERHEAKHVSESIENTSMTWKIISIIMAIILVVLVIAVGVYYVDHKTNSSTAVDKVQIGNTNNSVVKLLIVEDPSCTSCGVDKFAAQVKQNLIPNLEVQKITLSSQEGKSIIKDLNATQLPIYLFSKNIDQRSDWTSKLAGAFLKVNNAGVDYYMLNPQFIQSKVMIKEPITTNTAVVYGNKSAKVTIYEFSDYECPFCAIAEGNTKLVEQFKAQNPGYVPPMPEVFKNYIDTGKVKLVFYNFPLVQKHKNALNAANAAMCANAQGKWLAYHESLFMQRDTWINLSDPKSAFDKLAQAQGLDVNKFDSCYNNKTYQKQIEQELALGESYGISGTPAFFINKNFISGAKDYSTFESIINSELAKN